MKNINCKSQGYSVALKAKSEKIFNKKVEAWFIFENGYLIFNHFDPYVIAKIEKNKFNDLICNDLICNDINNNIISIPVISNQEDNFQVSMRAGLDNNKRIINVNVVYNYSNCFNCKFNYNEFKKLGLFIIII